MNKKYILLIALFIVFSFFFYYNEIYYFPDKKYFKEVSYCKINEDCRVYNCSNCGNEFFLERAEIQPGECQKNNNQNLSCQCVSNICKRHYSQ